MNPLTQNEIDFVKAQFAKYQAEQKILAIDIEADQMNMATQNDPMRDLAALYAPYVAKIEGQKQIIQDAEDAKVAAAIIEIQP